ncbi:hypothetical protein QBC47DRAFT_423686 [Echria macrotheca]|uniref:RBR-type E3 ubiquitin transferase n=1 Tax=Echria macrotheca TaxID=438768 RepID=A0AAJ0BAM8_9PEZI|nr:hypothetical protein QBC47DRAFT_423686 [Echria macrotheca]
MTDDEQENLRDIELTSLTSIYPELQQVHADDRYTLVLDVPVTPVKPVTVFFPAAAEANTPGSAARLRDGAADGANGRPLDSHELAHLPSLRLELSFGPNYPAEEPPRVSLLTTPPWLPAETLRKLEGDAARLWEEMGRDMVGFTYIDHVQQSVDDVFGLVGDSGTLEVDPRHKIGILDFDMEARKAAFQKETFSCGVCLDPKKGSACHKMMDCGHVFCVSCLQDFYNNAIKEGDLANVRCLEPNCAKEREKAAESSKRRKKPRTFISPSELLQIPLEQDVVQRYVKLKYKNQLESDKNTIYCPRSWCDGAARSKKHKKPEGLKLSEPEDSESSDDEGQHTDGSGKTKPYNATTELLAVCEDCGFAFCSRCFQSWHGQFVVCYPRRKNGELTEEDKASIDYLKRYSTPCPTCAAPAQKTHGCNHMICYRCRTHFCYLCSAWLDPGNPYGHFNQAPSGMTTGCYMRLWELENGDGEDVGNGNEGGGRGRELGDDEEERFVPLIEEPEDEEEPEVVAPAMPAGGQGAAPHQGEEARQDNGQVGIAREGPLVLRIAANQPAGAGRGGPRRAPAPQQGQQGARGGGHQQGQLGQGPPPRGGGGRGRGQRGRGGGGGPRGLRQNNQANQANQQRGQQQRRNANINHDEAPGARDDQDEGDHDGGELNPEQRAWVRQFVQLALVDQEDILFEDDEEVGGWVVG